MHNLKRGLLLFGALGLSACGMLQTPSKPTSPTTETTPNTEFAAQGTPTVCTNQSAGGSSPYNINGPLWRQQFFLNDNGTPLNYSTFSTDLPAAGNINMNPYAINATGATYTPQPWMYQHVYAPNVILTGTQTNGAAANNIVVTASGNYGLLYNTSLKQFELPVVSSSNKFKLYDKDNPNNLLPTEYGGSQTSMPSINGRVRIPAGQKVTLEFYLDPNVQYRKEMIWANFKDASGVSKTDWVTVNMPYQEGILKVNAATYTVQEPTGIKTYQSATNPLPKFKFVMRGYNNLVSSDRQFVSRQGIYYGWPSSVPSGNWTVYNQFMDERKDYVLNWALYDQKVGSATVDASGDPVLNADRVSTAVQWNLGTPSSTNDKNCISKTVEVYKDNTQFDVIMPGAVQGTGATLTTGKLSGPSVASASIRNVVSGNPVLVPSDLGKAMITFKNTGSQPLTYEWVKALNSNLTLSDENSPKILNPGQIANIDVAFNCPKYIIGGQVIIGKYHEILILKDYSDVGGMRDLPISVDIRCGITTLAVFASYSADYDFSSYTNEQISYTDKPISRLRFTDSLEAALQFWNDSLKSEKYVASNLRETRFSIKQACNDYNIRTWTNEVCYWYDVDLK